MSGLSVEQERETRTIAELEVRRYFDHYLTNIFPKQIETVNENVARAIEMHDQSPAAHDSVAAKVTRAKWILVGASAVGSAIGGIGGWLGIKSLIGVLVGG